MNLHEFGGNDSKQYSAYVRPGAVLQVYFLKVEDKEEEHHVSGSSSSLKTLALRTDRKIASEEIDLNCSSELL